jgi:uncharacterized protein (DUF433 family)
MSDPKYQRAELGKYIVADPYICHGQPTFKGTRKIVHLIVRSFRSGWTIDEIAFDHELPREAIIEALEMAAEAFLKRHAVPYPEPVPTEELISRSFSKSDKKPIAVEGYDSGTKSIFRRVPVTSAIFANVLRV